MPNYTTKLVSESTSKLEGGGGGQGRFPQKVISYFSSKSEGGGGGQGRFPQKVVSASTSELEGGEPIRKIRLNNFLIPEDKREKIPGLYLRQEVSFICMSMLLVIT
ncbi:hypothetical protein [Coleofasciculus sp. G2-EDA-02]|uniref:hypothetical protein n=1 Tax=Coleofasciculus sp. G2-EDA-02 TaxID=3069529 RepID=UPI00330233DD